LSFFDKFKSFYRYIQFERWGILALLVFSFGIMSRQKPKVLKYATGQYETQRVCTRLVAVVKQKASN
tara:strand:- start:65 stop:265 length:201 start_codon:yes stop_codon:yes gene_type:complete